MSVTRFSAAADGGYSARCEDPAAALAAFGSRYAALAAFLMGVTLVGFLTVETLVMGYQGPKQIRLVAMVAIPALVMIAVGWSAQVHAARRPTHTGNGEAIGG